MGRSSRRFERARPNKSTDDSLTDPPCDAYSESAARAIVLRRLTASARTRYELDEDLTDRGFSADVIVRVLDRFEEVGLVNDTEFAELWVASRHRTRGAARSVLRRELRNKGVSDELAESALAAISSEDELVRARALIERKLITLRSANRDHAQRRLVAFLLRRGYQGGVAFVVVSQALDLHDVQMDG
jgi:regulatory protein